ncbi:MAG: RNA 2'-phosphotransferase [Capnocytophaga sp.]|nr:RNA 2'-phosphotransferase [Capnocytophaga sp.]
MAKQEEKHKKESKFLSLVLRHSPEVIGITIDKHGWAEVDLLIKKMSKRFPFNLKMLEEIVATDSKQRYAFSEDKTKIRANQGHSITVELDLLPKTPPEVLYHGTASRFVESILKSGLLKQGRQYVHLSADIATATKVGSRHGNPVVFKVDAAAMQKAGEQFYLSNNGVWLTDKVPAEFLELLP